MPQTPGDDSADREDDRRRAEAAEGHYRRGRAARLERENRENAQRETSADWTRAFTVAPAPAPAPAPAQEPVAPAEGTRKYSSQREVMNHMWLRKGLRNGTLSLGQFGGSLPPLITPGEEGYTPIDKQFPRPDWPYPQDADPQDEDPQDGE